MFVWQMFFVAFILQSRFVELLFCPLRADLCKWNVLPGCGTFFSLAGPGCGPVCGISALRGGFLTPWHFIIVTRDRCPLILLISRD